MNRLICIATFGAVLFLTGAGYGDEFSPDSIKSIMRKVALYSFKEFGAGSAIGINLTWSGGTIMTGIMGLYRTTKEQQWLDSIDKWGNHCGWNWTGGGGDAFCPIQTFCERYIDDPKSENVAKYQPSKTALDGVLKSPVNHLFGWQDAVYMGLPDFSMMGYITGNPMYYDSLNAMFRGAEKDFQDPVYKLWYWNTSASFKKTPAGYPMFWGPGNAWVIGGVVRALKYMPKDSKYRPAWEATFKTFCDTLRIKQQPDGFWRTSLFEPTEYPDPESSCTAFFIYAMSLGVYWGILDSATYIPVIRKGWSALVKVVSPNGKVGYGQPTSNHPAPVSLNNELPEGHGSFLLAGEGVYLISNGQAVTSAPAMLTERKICGLGKVREVFLKGSLTFQVPENAKNLSIFDFSGKEWWRQAIPQMSRGKLIVLPKSALRNNVALLRFF